MANITKEKPVLVREAIKNKGKVSSVMISPGAEAYDMSYSAAHIADQLLKLSPTVRYRRKHEILEIAEVKKFLKSEKLQLDPQILIDECRESKAYDCMQRLRRIGKPVLIKAISIKSNEALIDMLKAQKDDSLDAPHLKIIPLPTLQFLKIARVGFRNITWKPGNLLTSLNAVSTGYTENNFFFFYGKQKGFMDEREFRCFQENVMTVPEIVQARESYMLVMVNNLQNTLAN